MEEYQILKFLWEVIFCLISRFFIAKTNSLLHLGIVYKLMCYAVGLLLLAKPKKS